MNGRYLLDTDIVIAIFSKDPAVLQRLTNTTEILIPSIVIGELYFGALKSTRTKENIAKIEEFARNSSILSCDAETAKTYGATKHRLKEKGLPVPENDLWIAAIALQHGLALVSRDTHFKVVDDLTVEVW